MKRISLTILMLTLATSTFGQRRIDLVTLKMIVTEPNSAFYYDSLVNRFLKSPKSFDLTSAVRLYYGKLYSPYYKLYRITDEEKAFNKLIKRSRYKKAIPIGEAILKADPVCLEISVKLLNAYIQEKAEEKADSLQDRVTVLMKAIKYSGSGDDEDSPIKVISIGDEYVIMALMGYIPLQRSSMMKQLSTLDSWIVREMKTNWKSNIFFEVLINLDALQGLAK